VGFFVLEIQQDTSRLFYQDDEIVVVASERPVIQTVFNVPFEKVEIEPGNALIIKRNDFYEGNFASTVKKHVLSNVFISLEEAMPKYTKS
jgi:hypothetical protein